MKTRKRSLPPGWYPAGAAETGNRIGEFLGRLEKLQERAVAGIVPHAGWGFSGRIALQVLQQIPDDVDTIVIIGGHLRPGDGVLAAGEDVYETPLGELKVDLELLRNLREQISIREDLNNDNTVEIQLPFLKFLYPQAAVLGLRAAPSGAALDLGDALKQAESSLSKKLVPVGSTDLTHYGPNYGFNPKGSGPEALKWVKEKNDKDLIEALLSFELSEAVDLANKEHSACSAGGAVAAARFAYLSHVTQGLLLEYTTSYDIHPDRSFVGYAGILYPLP